jgi:hypothetical protein
VKPSPTRHVISRALLFLLSLGGVGLNHAAAQSAPDGPARAAPPEHSRIGISLGWAEAIPPVGSNSALSASIDLARPGTGRTRLVAGLTYSRELESHGACCGPNPGYSYQEEALALSGGPEFTLASTGALGLAADVRYQPTWSHTIRRGSQEDFEPSPTRWQFSPWIASTGMTLRWPLPRGFHGSAGARVQLDAGGVTLGGLVRPTFGVNLGFGW